MKSFLNFLRRSGTSADKQSQNTQELEKQANQSLPSCLKAIDDNDATKNLGLQIHNALQVLEAFTCNKNVGLKLRQRLVLLVYTFGDPTKGFIAKSSSTKNGLPTAKIQELEELIANNIGYLTRFTRSDALLHVLVGKSPELKILHFDHEMKRLMDEIAKDLGIKDEFIASSPYTIVCNLLPDIREYQKKHISWEAYVTLQAKARDVLNVTVDFTQEIKIEYDQISKLMNDYIEDSLALITHEPFCILKQKALRQFWARYIHPLPIIPLSEFCETIKSYLSELHIEENVITYITSNLMIGLSQENEVRQGIDPYILAKISRYIPYDNLNFVNIISYIGEMVANQHILLLPSFNLNTEKVFYDPNQESEIRNALFSTPPVMSAEGTDTLPKYDIIGIYGPKLSGKTHRVLHIVHTQLLSSLKALSENRSDISSTHIHINTIHSPTMSLNQSTETIFTSDPLIDSSNTPINMTNESLSSSATLSSSSSSPDVDVIWVDFGRIDRELDGIGRLASQLFHRQCASMEDIETHLSLLLNTVKPGSLFIIDNLSFFTLNHEAMNRVPPGKRTSVSLIQENDKNSPNSTIAYTNFIVRLFHCLQTFQHRIKIVVICNDLKNIQTFMKFNQEIYIGPLTTSSSYDMITSYIAQVPYHIPLDIQALQTATSNIPGEIVLLLNSGSLGGIRKVAKEVAESSIQNATKSLSEKKRLHLYEYSWSQHSKSIVAIEIFNQLTSDEQLLSTCLFSNITHFDEALVWSMSKRVFHNDILRWSIAWKGLLHSGWIVHIPDLGYTVSSIAAYVQTSCNVLDIQQLHEWYISHWTDELVRINVYASNLLDIKMGSANLEYFTQNIAHFKHVIKSILNAPPRQKFSKSAVNSQIPLDGSSPLPLPPTLDEKANTSGTKSFSTQLFSRGAGYNTPVKAVTPTSTLDPLHHNALNDKEASIFSPRDHADNSRSSSPTHTHTTVINSPINTSTTVPSASTATNTNTNTVLSARDIHTNSSNVINQTISNDILHVSSMENLNITTPSAAGGPQGKRRFSFRKSKPECESSAVYIFPEKYTCIVKELTEEMVLVSTIQMKSVSKLTLEAILYKLAGKLGPLLTYCYSSLTAITITTAIKSQLSIEDREIYIFACVELAEQLLRHGSVQAALDEIFPIINDFYTSNEPIVNTTLLYAARSLIIYGKILMYNQSYQAAYNVFHSALSDAVLSPLSPGVAARKRSIAQLLKDEAQQKLNETAHTTTITLHSTPSTKVTNTDLNMGTITTATTVSVDSESSDQSQPEVESMKHAIADINTNTTTASSTQPTSDKAVQEISVNIEDTSNISTQDQAVTTHTTEVTTEESMNINDNATTDQVSSDAASVKASSEEISTTLVVDKSYTIESSSQHNNEISAGTPHSEQSPPVATSNSAESQNRGIKRERENDDIHASTLIE